MGPSDHPHSRPAVWVCVPTYNERENLAPLASAVLSVLEGSDVVGHLLIIDDNSPDGTGRLADELARGNSRISVLHRKRKEGIGPAYIDGFHVALSQGADLIVQMDCDFSHDPAAIPDLLRASTDADLVIGSRYVPGGGVREWGVLRRVISRGGSLYAQAILGLPIRDLTGGFKCFHRSVLEQLPLTEVHGAGYVFQVEMTYRAAMLGSRIKEVPIVFSDREHGDSKMHGRIVAEAAWLVPRLRWTLRR